MKKNKKAFIPKAQNGIEGTMGGLTDKGFNYNGAWGGTMQMGGNLPGAIGNMYARHGAPSEGKYAKKTLPSAQKGMQFYQQGLDFKPKTISKNGGWLSKYEDIPQAQIGISASESTSLPRNIDPRMRAALEEDSKRTKNIIAEETKREKQGVIKNTKPFEVEDRRSYFSDSRAKERGDDAWNFMQKATAAAQYVPHPFVSYPAVALNSVMGLTDAYYANQEGDITNRNINLIGALPIPSYNVIKQLGKGVGKKLKDKATRAAVFALGLDTYGTAADLTNNFGNSKKQQGGYVKKDDDGYWNPDNWGKPVEIGSNEITMDGVYQPLLGISNTGDVQMMYPGEDYTFDGESVTEYPVAQNGETLLKDKKVGQLETPIANLNLRPVYPNFKTKVEYVTVPGCPDGVGCSKQATMDAQKITGLPYTSYAPAHATFRDAVAERYGLKNMFDQEGKQRRNANSNLPNWKYPTPDDFNKWKAGDIVSLDAGGVDIFDYSPPPGFTWDDASQASHNGVIVGFTETGRPIIKHGAQKGRDRGKSWTEVLGKDNRVTDLGHGRYAIKSVWRPKEVSDDGTINTIRSVFDLGKDAAKRKQNTTSNEQFYLKNTSEEKLMKDAPVSAEFSGASSRLDTKKKLINLFNDEKLDKDLQYKFGITEEELNNLKPVVYGIFGQESNFNDIDSPAASFKEILGNMIGGNSRGAAQIKLKSLTPDEREILGVKKSSDLDSDEAAYKAALLMISNAKKRMDKEVAQGTHPELANVDENFRAGYYYNSPARAVNSAKEWAKKNKPVQWFNPLSWKNAITTRERPDVFGSLDPDYARKAELRMDEGSYPYKLMENAKDLGVDIDFEKGKDLEEVVVRGTNKPKTTFVKKENGGWLDKYK